MKEQGAREGAGRQRARELPAIEFRHAHRRSGESAAANDRERKHLRIGQTLGRAEAIQLAGMKVENAAIDGAHPQICVIAGQRSHVEFRKRRVKQAHSLAIVNDHAVLLRAEQHLPGRER